MEESYFKHTFQKKLLLYMPQREKEHLTQATQVLEKRRELEEVEKARKAEKEEFRMKMESLAARRDEIEMRENQLKESLMKFDTFIKENDAKLVRARNKAMAERDMIRQKEGEIARLLQEKEGLHNQLSELKHKVERYGLYNDYMHAVRTAGGYEEPRSIITRHKTLTSLLVQLRQKEKTRATTLETLRQSLATYREDLEDRLMLLHNTISGLQKTLDHKEADTIHAEKEFNTLVSAAAEKTLLIGKIQMAARNMYTLVRTRMGHRADSEDFMEQMTEVDDYVSDMNKVLPEIQKEAVLEELDGKKESGKKRRSKHKTAVASADAL